MYCTSKYKCNLIQVQIQVHPSGLYRSIQHTWTDGGYRLTKLFAFRHPLHRPMYRTQQQAALSCTDQPATVPLAASMIIAITSLGLAPSAAEIP